MLFIQFNIVFGCRFTIIALKILIRQAFETSGHDSSELIHEIEFANNINSLFSILSNVVEPTMDQMETSLTILREMAIDDPQTSKLGPVPEKLANAIAEAKVEYNMYGPRSLKAIEALKEAEHIVEFLQEYNSKDLVVSHHDYSAILDHGSLDDGLDALLKLKHFMRLVSMEKNILSRYLEDDIENTKISP